MCWIAVERQNNPTCLIQTSKFGEGACIWMYSRHSKNPFINDKCTVEQIFFPNEIVWVEKKL